LNIPQLSQFISRAERISSLPIQTSISLEENSFRILHQFEIRGHICFELTCDVGSLQVSQVDHIGGLCKQLTPRISDVRRVSTEITIQAQDPPDERASRAVPQWLRSLFRLFDGAQEMELGSDFPLDEAHETAKIGQEVLPSLRILRFDIGIGTYSIPVPRIIKSFVAERKLTGRPITVIFRGRHGSESA
jgi:hypothetical protein